MVLSDERPDGTKHVAGSNM